MPLARRQLGSRQREREIDERVLAGQRSDLDAGNRHTLEIAAPVSHRQGPQFERQGAAEIAGLPRIVDTCHIEVDAVCVEAIADDTGQTRQLEVLGVGERREVVLLLAFGAEAGQAQADAVRVVAGRQAGQCRSAHRNHRALGRRDPAERHLGDAHGRSAFVGPELQLPVGDRGPCRIAYFQVGFEVGDIALDPVIHRAGETHRGGLRCNNLTHDSARVIFDGPGL